MFIRTSYIILISGIQTKEHMMHDIVLMVEEFWGTVPEFMKFILYGLAWYVLIFLYAGVMSYMALRSGTRRETRAERKKRKAPLPLP